MIEINHVEVFQSGESVCTDITIRFKDYSCNFPGVTDSTNEALAKDLRSARDQICTLESDRKILIADLKKAKSERDEICKYGFFKRLLCLFTGIK